MPQRLKMSEWLEKYGTNALNTYFLSLASSLYHSGGRTHDTTELFDICERIANEFSDAANEYREFFNSQFPVNS